MRVALLVLVLLLAGCTSSDDMAEDPEPVGDPGEDDALEAIDPGATPIWEAGQTWTYKTLGYWDSVDQITLVAVPDGTGWLMAASSSDDLIDAVAWDHPYVGATDLTGKNQVMLSFPLAQGTSWTMFGANMTARAQNITWSGGTEPGFRADGDKWHIEYAPSAGWFTRFVGLDHADETAFGLELVSTGTATDYVWFERLDEDIASGGSATSILSVPAGADEVIAWALGTPGADMFVVPAPGGEPAWTTKGKGGNDFEVKRFAPSEGTWTFGGQTAGGEVYVQLHAVDWVESPIEGPP